nr:rod shape-determining protein RodA [Bacilli bacterium]
MESMSKRNLRDLDYWLIVVMVLLSIISTIAIYTATYGKANPATGNAILGIPSHILFRQIAYEIVSYVVMFLLLFIDYQSLMKFRHWFYGIAILLLLAVFAFHRVNGAHSWIPFPFFSFQPSELAKIVSILWAAGYMAKMNEREFPDYSFRGLLPILLIFIVPFLLIYKEPALGQSLVMLAIMYTMMFVYIKRKHLRILLTVSFAVVLVVGLSMSVYAPQTAKFLLKHHVMSQYQTDRIIAFLEPSFNSNSPGYAYQVLEAQIAVGSGGVFGKGLFKGTQTSSGWVPFDWTDFIFSAIAEQLGFVGSSVVVLLFLIMFYRLLRIAQTCLDDFGGYVIMGIVGMFSFQVFENIGMNLLITPATGITLPFVSYGGSSLIVNFISIGIALSVSVRRRTLRFD